MSVCDSHEFRLEALFPNFYDETWVSYTLKAVLEGLRGDATTVGATVLAKGTNVTAPYVHALMSPYLSRLVFPRFANPVRSVFRSVRRRLKTGDVAYCWLTNPAHQCKQLTDQGVMIVREMINCSLKLRRSELQKAYAALGESDPYGITDEMIEQERLDLLAADAIFCPNAFVRESVIEYGVPEDRCIQTSYGWGRDRLGERGRVLPDDGTFTVAFVGTIEIRKGIAQLLEAWDRSKINGRLLLVGRMSEEVSARFGHILSRSDIIKLGHVKDVGAVYRSADVFCFPTWEEGGPQVTLEAMSAGAAPVVTPMGTAGSFSAADDVGIIIGPGDVESLCSALCSLASDRPRLNYLKQRAMLRAADYTWERVGLQRRVGLLEKRQQWMANTKACGEVRE